MEKFEFSQRRSGGTLVVDIAGTINEGAVFPDLELDGIDLITLKLGRVSYIASVGVRRLFKWMWNINKARSQAKVQMCDVVSILMRQMVGVKDFIPQGFFIESMFVSYYCENCDENMMVPLRRGTDYEYGGAITTPHPTCRSCGANLELDDAPVIQGMSTLLKKA